MTFGLNHYEAAVTAALSECALSVDHLGPGRWNYTLTNGMTLRGRASLEGPWVVLYAPLSGRRRLRSFWSMLRLNAELSGFGKFALPPGRKALVLLAEIPLGIEDEAYLPGRVGTACLSFEQAISLLHGKHGKEPSDSVPHLSTDRDTAAAHDLQGLTREAGWSFKQRDGGSLVVDLAVQRKFHQADIVDLHDSGVRISASLAEFGSLSVESREALSLLLLSASGSLRLARAAIEETDERIALRFEVRLPVFPCPGELDHALSALSMACELCGLEAEALQDQALAKKYPQARGWSSRLKPMVYAARTSRGGQVHEHRSNPGT